MFFAAVKLTKHVDVNLYKYSGYGITLHIKGSCSIGAEVGRNIIFGVDTGLASHTDNKLKGILILGKGPTH